jgi:hypothetical protein
MPAPTLDRSNADWFLRVLEPKSDRFTFQTFTDSAEEREKCRAQGRRDPLARILHGSLVEHWNTLVDLSAKGSGIYVVVNETDFRGRAASNIVRVRAYFVDLDGAELSNLARLGLYPHLCVQTSHGRYHAYWRVEGAQLETFPDIQQRLAALMDGDPTVCDLSRVMRLPGFPHLKDPAKPLMVEFAAEESLPSYKAADLIAALAEAERKHSQSGAGLSLASAALAGISSAPDMTQGYPDGHRTRELTRRAGWCLGPGPD